MARTAEREVAVDRSRLLKMVVKAGSKGLTAAEVRSNFELDRNRPARVALKALAKQKEVRLLKHGRQLVAVTPDIRKLEREDEKPARSAEAKPAKAAAKKTAKKATAKKAAKKAPPKSSKTAAKPAKSARPTKAANGGSKPAKAAKKATRKVTKKAAKATAPEPDDNGDDNEDLLGTARNTANAQKEEAAAH